MHSTGARGRTGGKLPRRCRVPPVIAPKAVLPLTCDFRWAEPGKMASTLVLLVESWNPFRGETAGLVGRALTLLSGDQVAVGAQPPEPTGRAQPSVRP